MHSVSNAAVAVAGRKRRRSGGADRLSSLGDGALGHILSFLPAAEAARAAALSRRWRHVFATVHTLSFREPKRTTLSMGCRCYRRGDDDRRQPDPVDVPATRFVTGVSAALLGRDRSARAAGAPLRALRVAFDEFGFCGEDARKAVDAWLSYAAYNAGDALEIDLRVDGQPVCQQAYTLLPPPGLYAAEDDVGGGDKTMDTEPPPPSPPPAGGGEPYPGPTEYVYLTPRSLFSCASLRSLRLGGCWLDVYPATAALPSLATLHLTRVTGRRRAVQDLVDACPRLTDLTLEACRNLEQILVPDALLRRLLLRCCHELVDVFVGDTSELRTFEYRGGVPGVSLLSMSHPSEMSLCTLDFCGLEPAKPPEFDFLLMFVGVERLHLTSARLLGRGVIDQQAVLPSVFNFPTFPALRNLELTGMLPEEDDAAAIAAVTRILERTPRLETLSLFFLPEPHPVENVSYSSRYSDEEEEEDIHAAHKLKYDRHATLAVPEVEIPCLRERTKEINLVHYEGNLAQRTLAKFLLRNAPVVDEVCGEFAQGPMWIQTRLMEEIKGWVMNKSANMMFF